MTTLELTHSCVNHYIKYCFQPGDVPPERRPLYHRAHGLHISFGDEFNHLEYCLHLILTTPNWAAIVHDIHEMRRVKAYKRTEAYKHSKVGNQVQYRVQNLDPYTQVLIIFQEHKFFPSKLNRILKEWPASKPVIFLG